jgi:Ni,Fe-hydrogenase III small subunit
MSWPTRILKVGRIVRKSPTAPPWTVTPPTGSRASLQIRHVDAGSCNGCELELSGAFSPVYDAEQFGARLVASPRHADALLVTGVVTHNMRDALIDTLVATPEPRLVIAMGDCACDGGMFRDGYGVAGIVRDFVPVDVELRGCPPTPDQIVETLRKVTGR